MALLTISPALRSGTHAAPAFCRAAIDKRGLHPKLVRINGYVCFLGRFVCMAIAERTHFSIKVEARLVENRKMAKALLTS